MHRNFKVTVQKKENKMVNFSKSNEVEPIVFVNNPITNLKDDVVGFETQVKTIEKAIEDNATMIGIIADYGTGKSSVTDILSETIVNKPYKYPNPIKINMWDCLQNDDNVKGEDKISSVTNEIGDLTKSFLFQLANGKSRKLANYINKRLSNNYGLLSIGFSSKLSWLFLIISVLSFAISKISSLDKIYVPSFANEWLINVGKIIYDVSPAFLGLAIIFGAIGISFSSIAFSHWKMEKKSSNEVNDVFDAYEYIINKLRPFSNKVKSFLHIKSNELKKQLIIIEDLDRISDKSIIIGFLKEIYRFQTSLDNVKDEFIFIISIKPEAMLKKVEKHSFEFDDDRIYSKIFDITISLKPIHYDDYDSILIQLLKSNPDKKRKLEKLINCEEIRDNLPNSFKWIKKGTNLTIRELKDRLNSAIGIMVALENKQYKNNSSAKFEACAAVSYLEHKFPNDYNNLIINEVAFSELIEDSYKIKNNKKEKIRNEIENDFVKKYETSNNCTFEIFTKEFKDELCDLIYEGIFDKDFRMYFYSYPKNSHIKTTEEKYLCDLLELPYSKIDANRLNLAVEEVYLTGEENVVTDTIRKDCSIYPDVVLLNSKLLTIATKNNPSAVIESIYKNVFENIDADSINMDYKKSILNKIRNLDNRDSLIEGIIHDLLLFAEKEKLISSRKLLITTFNVEILLFKELFFADVMITKEEINLLNSPRISVKLIDPKSIDVSNYEYVSSLLTSIDLNNKDDEVFNNALKIFDGYLKLVDIENIANDLLKFMKINSFINEDYFNVILKETNESVAIIDIANYLNSLPLSDLTLGGYMEAIDGIGFRNDIDLSIVNALIESGYYYTPLLYCSENNKLNIIPFQNMSGEIIDEIKNVQSVSRNLFLNIRKYIILNNYIQEYEMIFFGGFYFITKEEYLLIKDTSLAIKMIDTAYIDEDTTAEVCDIINSKNYNKEEIIFIFRFLFDSGYSKDNLSIVNVIQMVIDNLDFHNSINLNLLSETERDFIVNFIYDLMSFDNPKMAFQFMKKAQCLIPSLETTVQSNDSYDDEYIEYVNNLENYTNQTIEWITKRTPDSGFPLCICDELYKRECYYEYIPALSLHNNELVVDEKIDFGYYSNVYEDVDEMFDLMSNNIWFLENLRDNGNYSKLNTKQLRALYKVEQTERLFRYVFDNFDDEEKMYYLNYYSKFKTEEDSKKFQVMICKAEHIELLGDIGLFYKIKQSLWESNPTHKGLFTRAWNSRWKKELMGG